MEYIQGNSPSDEDVLRFQVRRNITLLFKSQLEQIEDLIVEHDDALNKLANQLPEEYHKFLDLADYLTEAKAELLRKKILRSGNEAIRSLEEVLKGFEVRVK